MREWWVAAAWSALAWGAPPAPDCAALKGWTQKGEVREFVADNLFEYMNGNAEGYLAYGFRTMRGVTCVQGETQIVFDISEMESPELAWGIFVSNRDPRLKVEKIGVVGQITERRAIFTKGKYYLEMAANPAGDHRTALRALVADWERRIEGETEPPAILSAFPPEGLDRESLRLVPESLLGYRMLRRGFTAQYDKGKAFILPEASPQAAAGLMSKLKERLGGGEAAQVGEEGFARQDKYLGKICIFRKGRYLGGFTNLPAEADAVGAARKLAERLK